MTLPRSSMCSAARKSNVDMEHSQFWFLYVSGELIREQTAHASGTQRMRRSALADKAVLICRYGGFIQIIDIPAVNEAVNLFRESNSENDIIYSQPHTDQYKGRMEELGFDEVYISTKEEQ